MDQQNPYFIERNSEPVKVIVITRDLELHGFIHLPVIGKDARRLTNYLNSSERQFITLSKVLIFTRGQGLTAHQGAAEECPFLHINLSAVEIVKPIDF